MELGESHTEEESRRSTTVISAGPLNGISTYRGIQFLKKVQEMLLAVAVSWLLLLTLIEFTATK